MSRWDPLADDDPLLQSLSIKAKKEKIPLSGMISLTARCNLKCIHCYISGSKGVVSHQELSTAEYQRVLDEVSDLGTLFLTITGGEPLVRSDFKELYSYAKKCGFLITLFSNATLIDKDIVALLKDLPPRYVDISLYGATEKTYESITGIKGSYRQCLAGIELLLKNDIKVHLKSVLMKPNIDEFSRLKELALSYDVPFRIDSMVFGKFNGDKSPLDLRISAEQSVKCEAQMDKFIESVRKSYDGSVLKSDRLYSCGAGRSTFHITESGLLQPCLMVTDIVADLRDMSLRDAWRQINKRIDSLQISIDDKCQGCDLYTICGYCPPMGKYSSYNKDDEKEYFCEIGRARRKLV